MTDEEKIIVAEKATGYHELLGLNARAVRVAVRRGDYSGQTAGLALGRLQCNVVILPHAYALDFMRYCQRNPKPCPLVGAGDTGAPLLPTLGADIDIRSDVPSYNVYRDGEFAEHRADIRDLWRDDLVAFALGCSFTFERALMAAGFPMRHIEQERTVPMYRTNIATLPAGRFSGGTVVSMRPLPADRINEIADICRRFPHAHGAPVHVGDPSIIGIADLSAPDWGDAVDCAAGEAPVFWACGVTPQNAIAAAVPPLCVTHTPGCMLVSDVPEDAEFPIIHASAPAVSIA